MKKNASKKPRKSLFVGKEVTKDMKSNPPETGNNLEVPGAGGPEIVSPKARNKGKKVSKKSKKFHKLSGPSQSNLIQSTPMDEQ